MTQEEDSLIAGKVYYSMKRYIVCPISLVLLLALMLLITACGGTSTTTTPVATATPDLQPISGQQILAGPVTYVALGASDAVGVGTTQPASQGYVPLIEQQLPEGSHLVDLGISGIRLHQALTQELPLALNTNPKLITIWLVANDFVGHVPYASYMHDLNTLLQQLRAGTKARIVMANLPDMTLLPAFSQLTTQQKTAMRAQIQHWNAGIATIAAKYHVAVVNLYSQRSQLTAHPNYVSGDGFHPSPAGYAVLAKLFWQAIK
jgi:acyl-CoA thioesterase-1